MISPAPWEMKIWNGEVYSIEDREGQQIILINQENNEPKIDDIRLIAAAPDLLEELKRCHGFLYYLEKSNIGIKTGIDTKRKEIEYVISIAERRPLQ